MTVVRAGGDAYWTGGWLDKGCCSVGTEINKILNERSFVSAAIKALLQQRPEFNNEFWQF